MNPAALPAHQSPETPHVATVNPPASRPLILGSTSPYRRELLQRLHIAFDVVAPDVDETPLPDETPRKLAERLALAKAHAVASQSPRRRYWL